jgi:hypothetical protein
MNEKIRKILPWILKAEVFKKICSYSGQCDDFIFSFWNFLTFSNVQNLRRMVAFSEYLNFNRSSARAYFDIGCFMLRKYCKKRSNLNIGLLIYVSFWCHIHYRMSKVVADHDDLLTHWRYIYMSKFITKIFLIQTTLNYFWLQQFAKFWLSKSIFYV